MIHLAQRNFRLNFQIGLIFSVIAVAHFGTQINKKTKKTKKANKNQNRVAPYTRICNHDDDTTHLIFLFVFMKLWCGFGMEGMLC